MDGPRISRRTVLKALGAAAALPLLQACGGQSPATPGASAPTAASGAATPAQAGGKTAIRFASWLSSTKGLLERYNASQTRVSVAYEEIPFAQFADKLLIDMASGTAPDSFHWPSPWWIPTMRKKVFLPLDERIAADKLDLAAFSYAPEKIARFDGKLWGMPYALPTTRVLIYNKRHFKEAGVAEPTDTWTWDDLTAAAQKLHRPPNVYAMPIPPHQLNIESMIIGNGGKILDDEGRKCLLDAPEAVAALQASIDWYQKHKVTMEPGQETSLGEDPFASDKLAMAYISIPGWQSWKRLTRDLTIDAGTAQFPMSPQTKQARLSGESHMTAIFGKTKAPDAAWDLFKWSQTNDEAMKYWLEFYPVNFKFQQYAETITDARQREVTGLRLKYMPRMEVVNWGPNTSEAQKAFRAEYDLALLGKKPTGEAMKAAARAISDIVGG